MFILLIGWLCLTLAIHGFVIPKVSERTSADITPFTPPSYPLAVRSPYLSAWLPGSSVSSIATAEPQFWAGQTLGWTVAARVGGVAYSLFGNPGFDQAASLTSANYTATHSYFTVSAGDATFTLDFFSPVSPNDYVRQSLPFSYLTVSVDSDSSGDVQIYSDIDSSWVGSSAAAHWSSTTTNKTTHWEIRLNDVINYGENSDMALWGQAVYASRPYSGSSLTTQSGASTTVRDAFANSGNLTGVKGTWSSGGVVGFAHDLGSAGAGAAVTFAVGHQRNWTINYLGEDYTSYYRSEYPTISSAVSHFLDDLDDARSEAAQLESTLNSKAEEVSSKYADILNLSLRQAFGAIEITIPESTLDTSSPLGFIKELSSNGNLNTVDIIFPAFPIYYLTNPSLIPILLEPMMRYLAAGRWCKDYIIHDMGSHYPNATGHDDCVAEAMPLEESGNLILLALAYQQATGDTTWASSYQSVFTTAADYLAANGWYPAYQYATTDAAGAAANQTILAIKSALGLIAYDQLFSTSTYTANGTALATALYDDRLGTDAAGSHWVLSYGNTTSWIGAYNLFPDRLLNLSAFPSGAYEMQNTDLPSRRVAFGVPLDSRVTWSKTDWNSWNAAIAEGITTATGTGNDTTRDLLLDDIWTYAADGLNDVPFADRYWVAGEKVGRYELTRARPTVGAHFAVLALREGAKALAV